MPQFLTITMELLGEESVVLGVRDETMSTGRRQK